MPALQLDDNLVPGQTYTFTFVLGNLISLPSTAQIVQELLNDAPEFIQNVGVTESSGLGLFTNYYNVTFTYAGDGSDVVSDVANEMIAAFANGGDTFTFSSANGSAMGQNASTDISGVTSQVAQTVGTTVGGAVNSALTSATSGLGGWLIPVVLVLAIVLLFQLGGVSGLRRSFA